MKYLILLLAFTTTLSAQRTPIVTDYEIGEELNMLGDTNTVLKSVYTSIDTFLATGHFIGERTDTTMSITSGTGVTSYNEYTTKCDTFLAIAVEYTWGPPSWQEQPKIISLYETRCGKHYTGTSLFVADWPTSKYYNLDFTPFIEDRSKFYIFMVKPLKYD